MKSKLKCLLMIYFRLRRKCVSHVSISQVQPGQNQSWWPATVKIPDMLLGKTEYSETVYNLKPNTLYAFNIHILYTTYNSYTWPPAHFPLSTHLTPGEICISKTGKNSSSSGHYDSKIVVSCIGLVSGY